MEILPQPPFVGAAAVTWPEQLQAMSEMSGWLPHQALACGIQISSMTLRNEPNFNPAIFPTIAQIAELVRAAGAVQGLEIHPHLSPGGNKGILDKLKQLSDLFGDTTHGLQLNLSFPDIEALGWWCDQHPGGRLILPITPKVLKDVGHDPAALFAKFATYRGLVTDLFFDLSGGQGKPVNPAEFLAFTGLFRKDWPELRLAVAGGLGPNTMAPVAAIIKAGVWPLSWDAESGLCTEGIGMDLDKVRRFVLASAELAPAA